MGTPSTIWIKCTSGRVVKIGINFDGYYAGVGLDILKLISSTSEEDLNDFFESLVELPTGSPVFDLYTDFEKELFCSGGGQYYSADWHERYHYDIDLVTRSVTMTEDEMSEIDFDLINSTIPEQLYALLPQENEDSDLD